MASGPIADTLFTIVAYRISVAAVNNNELTVTACSTNVDGVTRVLV